MRLKSITLNVSGSFDTLSNQNKSFLQNHDCPENTKRFSRVSDKNIFGKNYLKIRVREPVAYTHRPTRAAWVSVNNLLQADTDDWVCCNSNPKLPMTTGTWTWSVWRVPNSNGIDSMSVNVRYECGVETYPHTNVVGTGFRREPIEPETRDPHKIQLMKSLQKINPLHPYFKINFYA